MPSMPGTVTRNQLVARELEDFGYLEVGVGMANILADDQPCGHSAEVLPWPTADAQGHRAGTSYRKGARACGWVTRNEAIPRRSGATSVAAETCLPGLDDCRGSVGHLELGEDVRDVVAHGFEADHKFVGDRRVAFACSDHLEHLAFTVGQ